MSSGAQETRLVQLVPDDRLQIPDKLYMLLDRLEELNNQTVMTPTMRLEAWAISRLLARHTISSGQLLDYMLVKADLGAEFPVTHNHAHILNPLIERQRTVWNNLEELVKHGRRPNLPTPLDERVPNRELQAAVALDWWTEAIRSLIPMINQRILTPDDVANKLPQSVRRIHATQLMGGPYLLGYALYQQQCSQNDKRQLVHLADTLATAVNVADMQVSTLKLGSDRKTLVRCVTHLSWHLSVLHGFVVAALDDPEHQLQTMLIRRQNVQDSISVALCAENADHPRAVNWADSSNADTQSKTLGDLMSRLADSVRQAELSLHS